MLPTSGGGGGGGGEEGAAEERAKDEPEDELAEVAEDAEVVVPPDGGWGWVVVAASFACNMVVDGIIFSFGIFLPHIAATFAATSAEISLVGSLMSGFYLMTGPFASALANRYGFRLVAILGSILGVTAFVLSYFSTSVPYLYISYGVLGGVGFGLVYVPAVLTVGFYFETYRALATGVGVCGSGIGTFLFAPLSSALIERLGWQGALLAQAALVASCLCFGLAFRPVRPTRVADLRARGPARPAPLVMEPSRLPARTRAQMEHALRHIANSQRSLTRSQTTIHRLLGANHNADYPTVADVYHTITVPPLEALPPLEKRLSAPFLLKEAAQPLLGVAQPPPPPRRLSGHRARTSSEVDSGGTPARRRATLTEVNRPLYRDDIFFGASLARLPQYQSQSALAYSLSVTRLPTKTDIGEEVAADRRCRLCPEAVRRTLATMLDVSLLRSPAFMFLAFSGFFTMMGFYVPFMFVAERAAAAGWPVDSATWLLSAIGVANTLGRIFCGLLSFFPQIDTLLVNNVALSIGGVATILSGCSSSPTYQFLYCCVFGLSISTFASLRSILVVELVGLEKLTNAFGLLLLFQGVAAAMGTPTAGAFMDATGSYDASFYLSGALILFSAVLCYPLHCISSWEKRRADAAATRKSLPV